MKKDFIHLETTASTNDVLKNCPTPPLGELTVAIADFQTKGRGQAGNSWESERGKNLLMSILTGQTDIHIERQFVLSMAGALALKAALDDYTDGISLKWPNDIYWHDRKISGTLIETSVSGRSIQRCIYGIGLNVNQKVFVSEAPNPVSLYQILGKETDIDEIMAKVLNCFDHYYMLATSGETHSIAEQYNKVLFWRDGIMHCFEDTASHVCFNAYLVEVGTDGLMSLRHEDGSVHKYALKEVRFCL